jgi:hypothetical protein
MTIIHGIGLQPTKRSIDDTITQCRLPLERSSNCRGLKLRASGTGDARVHEIHLLVHRRPVHIGQRYNQIFRGRGQLSSIAAMSVYLKRRSGFVALELSCLTRGQAKLTTACDQIG